MPVCTLVEHEKRTMAAAEGLHLGEISGVGQNHAGLALDGLQDDCADAFLVEDLGERGEVVEGDFESVRQHGAKAVAPKRAAHQRECAAGESVEGATRVDDAVAAGAGACEFDDRFDALAAGAAEEGLFEVVAGALGEFTGQLAGGVGDVALQHDRAAEVELGLERGNDVGVVVASVVDAIAGQKIEEDAAALGVQFATSAAQVADIHAEQVEQADPFGVDVVGVGGVVNRAGGWRGGHLVGRVEMFDHGTSRMCVPTSLRRIRLVGVSVILKPLRVKRAKSARLAPLTGYGGFNHAFSKQSEPAYQRGNAHSERSVADGFRHRG
jgi:hypothetical protein